MRHVRVVLLVFAASALFAAALSSAGAGVLASAAPAAKPKPKKVVLCFKRKTIRVPKSQVRRYRKRGAKLGACKKRPAPPRPQPAPQPQPSPPPPTPAPPPVPPPAQRTVSIADAVVVETTGGSATFAVTLSSPHAEAVTVQYSTTDSTAKAGSDYGATASSVAFLPGQTTRQIEIPLLNDALDEDPETFFVSLLNPVNATISRAVATGTIIDDADVPPVVDIEGTSLLEPNLGGETKTANVTVKLSAPSGKTITVPYATEDGTAGTADYVAKSGTLTFNPGETVKQAPVTVSGDAVDEGNETFTVRLLPSATPVTMCAAGCFLGLREFPVPTASSRPTALTAGPDGRVWFTEKDAAKIGRITSDGVFDEVDALFTGGGQPTGIALGPDARVWYAGRGTPARVAALNASGHTTAGSTGFSSPVNNPLGYTTYPTQITEGPDGNMWFAGFVDSDGFPGGIAGEATAVFDFDFHYTGHTGESYDIVGGPNGNVWATEGYRIVEVTPSGTMTEHLMPRNAGGDFTASARGITVGPDGALWFTDDRFGAGPPHQIGRMSPLTGEVTAYPIPGPAAGPLDIVTGPDGNLWFTEETGNRIARLTPGSGAVVGYALPVSNSKPSGIAVGPDGNIWFTEPEANKIGRVDLGLTKATVMIANDDYPELGGINAGVNEPKGLNGASGGPNQGVATVRVSLSRCGTRTVTLDWRTADLDAVAGSDYEAASGTLTFAPGECTKTIGVRVLSDGPSDVDEGALEEFSVQFSKAQGAVWPRFGDAYDTDATVRIFEERRISINDVNVSESGGTATFTVSMNRGNDFGSVPPITVGWATRNVDAQAPGDYAPSSGTVSFGPGEASRTVTVPVQTDSLDELDEQFAVDLGSPSQGVLKRPTGTATILDDDEPPPLSVADVTVGQPGTAVFTITLGAASGRAVGVGYRTRNGTATAPADYTAQSGNLVFAPGETTKTVRVPVHDPVVFPPENEEYFELVLEPDGGAAPLDLIGRATIQSCGRGCGG